MNSAHRPKRGFVMKALVAVLALSAGSAMATPFFRGLNYVDPYHAKVKEAGYVEKTAKVNNITLSYAEGPNNGPPLVLLHAQFLDWFSYSRVLPALAKSFHVYDIDYPGHGKTVTPANYPMTANQIGSDLSDFISKDIGQAVYISGNSSGGLLATWLAANRPQQIKAALLEDPPLFSSEYPAIKKTIAYRAFKTSYTAVKDDHPDNFILYWVQKNAAFFRNNIGPGTPYFLSQAITTYHRNHPGQPVELGRVKNDTIRMMLRGLDQYDPRFGAAFYDGSWNKGFDQGKALAKIQCPVLLMQADYSYKPGGILDGAMSKEDAQAAMALLKHGTYQKVDATHVVNLDKPQLFIEAIEHFFLGKKAG
ncbi:alpha/beta fold hydrolase [Gallaecimonas mangrovi]|uniref:alpha/beta fold hydrolase n=1 Tax=Gallaecimonas mangrovi TaxID=2291597 RepID=UPI001D002B1E|nr:alpha/beta hydrolase [Gallaecimonas mangrovi]